MLHFRSLRNGVWTSDCGRFDLLQAAEPAWTVRLVREEVNGPLLPEPVTLGTADTAWKARAICDEWNEKRNPDEYRRFPLLVGKPGQRQPLVTR